MPSTEEGGVEGAAGKSVDSEQVLRGLEVGGQCPEHLGVIGDVDVVVNRDDRLEVGVPTQEAEHHLAGLTHAPLAELDVAVEVATRVRVVDRQ